MEIVCPNCKRTLQVDGGRIKIPSHSRPNGDPCFMSGREHDVTKPTTRDPARIRERTEKQMAKDEEARKAKAAQRVTRVDVKVPAKRADRKGDEPTDE